MKKLKEVTWNKCESFEDLLEKMLCKSKVLVGDYNFYFNDQQHQIADINRTLKNHNDWKHKINCYYSGHTYYMVIFKKDSIEVVYYEDESMLNPKLYGYIFLNKYRKYYKNKVNEEAKLYDKDIF